MNIVLDVAQGVLGDFSDLLFFTEFFGGVPELSWDPKKAGCVMDNPKITWDDLWVTPIWKTSMYKSPISWKNDERCEFCFGYLYFRKSAYQDTSRSMIDLRHCENLRCSTISLLSIL